MSTEIEKLDADFMVVCGFVIAGIEEGMTEKQAAEAAKSHIKWYQRHTQECERAMRIRLQQFEKRHGLEELE